MKIKTLVIVICIFSINNSLTDFTAFGQEKEDVLNLSIDSAIEMALEASESLKLGDNEVKRKDSEKKEEKSYLYPNIIAEVGWSNNFEYPDTSIAAATKDYHMDSGLTISQTIFTFGRLSHAISAAQKALEASRFDRESTKQEIIYDAKIAFYNTYFAKRVMEIAEESYNNALNNKKILEARVSGGRTSKYDNIKISADIAARKPSVNNARADFMSAIETLKIIIGVGPNTIIKLAHGFFGEYPDIDRQTLAQALYDNQPAIKALAKSIEEKKFLVKSKKATLFPEVSAFATWNHKGDGYDYYVESDNLDDYGVVGLKVNLPIWLGGINWEQLCQAKLDKADAELKYKQSGEEYLLLLDKSVNEYREYKKTLEANNESIRWALEFFKYSQELFSSGQVSITDLNDAELQLTNAKISKEATIFNLNIILAQIKRLTLTGNTNE